MIKTRWPDGERGRFVDGVTMLVGIPLDPWRNGNCLRGVAFPGVVEEDADR